MDPFIGLAVLLGLAGMSGYVGWMLGNPGKLVKDEEERVWQRLAESLGLEFIAGGVSQDTVVRGSYQGHSLVLRTLQQEWGGVETFVILSQASPPEKVTAVEPVLNRLVELAESGPLKGTLEAEANGTSVFYQHPGFETDTNHLQIVFKLLHELLILRAQVTELGGEAIPTLQTIRQKSPLFRQLFTQMMIDINRETDKRLEPIKTEVWCPRCLARFKVIETDLMDIHYHGCRICGQSRDVFHLKNGVVALLDNQEKREQSFDEQSLKVNWFQHPELFDFDRVEIIQATDEEVERFAVQVGNDTDEVRQGQYKKMQCWLLPEGELSVNTLRVLKHIFGEVGSS